MRSRRRSWKGSAASSVSGAPEDPATRGRIPLCRAAPYLRGAIRESALKHLFAALIFLLSSCGQGDASLTVANAEYRAPLGASGVGVAYFSVTSARADRIVAVSSPQAASVEMHGSVNAGGQASMKRLETVLLPAGETVTFGPKGMHLMVFEPKPQAAGATFPIQITLKSGRMETILFHPALSGR